MHDALNFSYFVGGVETLEKHFNLKISLEKKRSLYSKLNYLQTNTFLQAIESICESRESLREHDNLLAILKNVSKTFYVYKTEKVSNGQHFAHCYPAFKDYLSEIETTKNKMENKVIIYSEENAKKIRVGKMTLQYKEKLKQTWERYANGVKSDNIELTFICQTCGREFKGEAPACWCKGCSRIGNMSRKHEKDGIIMPIIMDLDGKKKYYPYSFEVR